LPLASSIQLVQFGFKSGTIGDSLADVLARKAGTGVAVRMCVDANGSGAGGASKPRWVKASPALLTALRDHVSVVELEGQVKDRSPGQRVLLFPTTVERRRPVTRREGEWWRVRDSSHAS
jgi:phosphatidylserine/phosphatidylglycerophosphate/cardiolipin synthase-like enzyme